MNFTSLKERFFYFAALVFMVTASSFIFELHVNAAAKNLKVWKLVQNENLLGDRIVYLDENGIKFVYTKGNYTLLYAAPDWCLHYFNKDRKTIFSSSVEQWQKSLNFRLKLVKGNFCPENPVVIKTLSHLIGAHKVQSYVIKSLDNGHTTKHADGSMVVETNWDVADEIKVSPKVNLLVDTWGQSVGRNFPVFINVLLGDGVRKERLVTHSIERVTVLANFFDVPKNYAPVKSESEITLGSDLINDMVNDLGTTLGKP